MSNFAVNTPNRQRKLGWNTFFDRGLTILHLIVTSFFPTYVYIFIKKLHVVSINFVRPITLTDGGRTVMVSGIMH